MDDKKKSVSFPSLMKIIFTLSAIVLLVGGGLFYQLQQQENKTEVENLLSSIAKLKASQIQDWRTERVADASILMERKELLQDIHLYLTTQDERAVSETLNRLKPIRDRLLFRDILLVDTTWKIQLSFQESHCLLDFEQKILDRARIAHRPIWTKLHTSQDYPQIHNSVVAPLFAATDEVNPIGFLVLISEAGQYLYPLIQSWPIPSQTAETLLVRREGKDVLFLNELRHRKDSALKLRIPMSQTENIAVMAATGKKGIVYGKDYRGVDVVAEVLAIPDSPWFMVAKIDMEEAFGNSKRHLLLIMLLILGGLGLIGVGSMLVYQRTLKAQFRDKYKAEAALRELTEQHSVTLHAIGDAVIATDATGRVELMNPVAEALTGWREEEALGKNLGQVFHITSEVTGEKAEDPVARVLREGFIVGLANHTMLISRDGKQTPIADSGAPIRNEKGTITGVVLVFRDQTEERMTRLLTEKRLSLITYAISHTLEELLTYALDEAGTLVDSPVGFYHLVDPDQKTLSLQQWSTEALKEFLRSHREGRQCSIEKAGVWADCVREKAPVIHNDYASLSHKKGLPEGHFEVIRELTVPVIRKDKVVAIVGVGNKPADYDERDVEIVSYLADITWEIIQQKRTQLDQVVSESKYRSLFEGINDAVFVHPVKEEGFANFIEVNEVACRRLGYSREELLNLSAADISAQKDVDLRGSRDVRRQLLTDGWIIIEAIHVTKDGKKIPVEISSRIFEMNDRPMEMSLARDITERKKMEQTLIENEERYRSIYENVAIGLYRSTPDGRILMANPTLFRMLGYSSFEEMAERNIESDPTYYESRNPREKFKELVEQHGFVTGLESAWKRKDGSFLWVRENARLISDENGKVLYYEGSVENVTERRLAEEKVRESEGKYRLIFENAPLGVFHFDKEGMITSCNDTFVEMIGSSREQLVGLNMLNLPDKQIVQSVRESLSGNSGHYEGDYHSVTAGKVTPARILFTPVISETGEVTGGIGISEDITERREAETERENLQEQLLQSQKMESVGRLAGGVAHDYNNMLGVILGRAEMLLAKIAEDDPNRGNVEAIMRAGQRSADLTRQLLAFARKQTIQPKVMSLNDTIENMLKMLRRLIGENIDLAWQPATGLWTVEMDPVQVDQILANLCVNARDAIPETGDITIETENKVIDETYCVIHPEAIPGSYVMLAVSDDGSGMDEETRTRIFEPFFTTKGVGEGTGLGLSTVYGIVKQNDGFINVYSEPDEGTTFRIYIPKHEGQMTEETGATATEIPHGTGQQVLLVEDEEVLLEMAKAMLEELGYQVQTASLPTVALSFFQDDSYTPDLLITDVVMPGMSGKELAGEISKLREGVKMLFMSGYTANAIAHHGVLDKGVDFIQKPFSLNELARKVKKVLDKP